MQLWEDEIVARLASYKQYPSSALQQLQQDTVKLHFSVDHTGQVTYSRVDSLQHYPALEQEVQQMLRLAGRLPLPPSHLSGDAVVTVPVQFSLDFTPNMLCGASGCPAKRDAQSKPKAVAPPPPTLASCTAAASPGPAPAGSAATLEQMRAYREQLNQYLAAAGNQLACLSQVRETPTLALRDKLTRQLHSMVDDFNAQAGEFEAKAKAKAQALMAQVAGQVYAPCTAPPVARPPATLTAEGAQAFRRQLITYQSEVRSYVACLQKADLAAAAPNRGLASDQRAQLAQTGVQLGDAAIQSFNQLAGRFNAQVPHLRQQALAAQARQQNLAEAVVRGTAIFPSSMWDLPVPLPPGECVAISQFGQSYRAALCNPTYTTTVSGLSQQLKNNVNRPNLSASDVTTKSMVDRAADAASGLPAQALQQEAIAAEHGIFPGAGCALPPCPLPILGIAVTTQAGLGGQVSTGPTQQTVSYSVSELQVSGRRLSMTITRRSDQDGGTDDARTVHFDLVLSPDNQTLHGYCWTGQQHQQCTLPRHASASGPEKSRH
ncbi:MAG TPA: TonB family protein [Steroidobacteraceae bacterium]|nr:TonB family protein [Steroidobacteraceae bacterium]